MSKNVLITGGAGFVGSNLALKLKSKYPAYKISCLDSLKRRGSELNIPRLKEHEINFIHGDIRNREDLAEIKEADIIIDASAEPSVLAGITSPIEQVVNNNLIGTINCLELAKRTQAAFIFLSTSRVYPIKTIEELKYEETESRFTISSDNKIPGVSVNGFSELFPLGGSRSFYGATKLASELMIQEYHSLCNIKTVINRFGVITGPWQMGKVDQGVVVLWAARHFWKQKLAYIGYGGEGKQTRDILHIQDLFNLIDHQMHNLDKVNGETFNAGGGTGVSVSLAELTRICQQVTGNKIEIERIPETRQADIKLYITDNSKITKATGWKPQIGPEKIIEDIFLWIKENERQLSTILK